MPRIFEMLLLLLLVLFIAVSCTVDQFTPYRFVGEMKDPGAVRMELVVIEENGAFIRELKKLKNIHPFGDPAYLGADGKAIMLTYPNGDIELIGIYGTTWIADGEMEMYTSWFDEEPYLAFWEKWAEMTDAVPA